MPAPRPALLFFAVLIGIALLWPAIEKWIPGIPGGAAASSAQALFVDATSSSGLAGGEPHCFIESEEQYFVTGQAWGDADGDGISDLYLTSQCGPSTLLKGDGKGHFEASTQSNDVALAGRQAGGAVFADVDGDGWEDLLVLTYDGPVLFHNESGKAFVDDTARSGLTAIAGAHPVSAALADYDGDGALDIFISNYGCVRCLASPQDEVRSQLFHNDGNGRFTDVTALLGDGGPMGFSFVAGWGDFDNDGDPDLYVTNDVRGTRTLHGNALYRNDGRGCGGWCFPNVSRSSGAGIRGDSMGLARADFNGDGWLDLFITNSGWAYTPLTGPSMLLLNRGNGAFRDGSNASRAEVDAMAWGAAAVDADSDGWPDLYVALGTDPTGQGGRATTNRLLRNAGGRKFEDFTGRSGAADASDSFGVVAGDANGDGQADLVVGDYDDGYRLFLGTGGESPGHRLVVRLRGGAGVNRDAVGARIEVDLSDGRRLLHEVSLGGTLGGNDDPAFRTGTGSATVSKLSVTWPDGSRQVVEGVPADSEVRWTNASEPVITMLPVIGVEGDLLSEASLPATGSRATFAAAMVACVALGLIGLAGWRRLQPHNYPAAGSPTARRTAVPSRSPGSRSLRLWDREYAVVFPSPRDPRLHVAAVIVSLQVLGQVVLGFHVSIAQVLVSLLTCGLIEFAITLRTARTITWPASAVLTGNGLAFILRVPGTEHGDWWSLDGWYLFAGVGALSVISKYAVRDGSRHIFNPSNLGLALAFLLLGSGRVEPLDFWWGPLSPGIVAAYVIILVGGLTLLRRLDYFGMVAGFWLAFAVAVGIVAASGHCMSARWSLGPVCGVSFWRVLLTSPEILVFMFFMMTDPRTTPAGRVARIAFGAGVGFLAALFLAPQQTEFGTKVAVLASLVVVCAVQLFVEKLLPAAGSELDSVRAWLATPGRHRQGPPTNYGALTHGGRLLAVVLVALALLIPAGASARAPGFALAAVDVPAGRPTVTVDPALLPEPVIDPAMLKLNSAISGSRAREIAHDVAEDLLIETMAVEGADREMARTAAAGAYLARIQRRIDGTGNVPGGATTYTFDSIKLLPVYDGVNAQAGPQYGLEVRGAIQRSGPAGKGAARPDRGEPFERTYALLFKGGHYLIAADFPVRRP